MAGAKETPRQKMIGMMYLVLTALLALNISKEVLNGFVKVENSLISTLNAIADKGDETHSTLFAKYLANEEKVKPFYNRAEIVKSDADSLVTYISQLKARCMSTSEGDYKEQELVDFSKYYGQDSNGRDTVLNLGLIDKQDEYTELTGFMVGSEANAPKEGDWTARQLRHAIEKYRDDLMDISVIDVKGSVRTLPDNIKKNLTERFSFEDEEEDGEMVLWEAANFYDVPLAAVMPLMSKMIIDVEDAEAEVLTWLLNQIESKSLKFSEVKPMVFPQSNYIIRGDTIRANILLAAFDPTRRSEIYLETERWDGVDSSEVDFANLEKLDLNADGDGLFSLASKSMNMGQYSYRGVIRYQGPDGDMQSKDFLTPIFTVAEAALVVSPIKMNVFYRGLDNPVKISVPGVANDKLQVSISSGHKIRRQSDGSYNVTPSTSVSKREAVISVRGEMPDGSIVSLGTADFRIKRIPDPVPMWTGKGLSDISISKSKILGFAPLGALMENFDFKVDVRVKSFTMRVVKNGTVTDLPSKNNKITDAMKESLGRLPKGNSISFINIMVGMPDGTVRRISSLTLKVTN